MLFFDRASTDLVCRLRLHQPLYMLGFQRTNMHPTLTRTMQFMGHQRQQVFSMHLGRSGTVSVLATQIFQLVVPMLNGGLDSISVST